MRTVWLPLVFEGSLDRDASLNFSTDYDFVKDPGSSARSIDTAGLVSKGILKSTFLRTCIVSDQDKQLEGKKAATRN